MDFTDDELKILWCHMNAECGTINELYTKEYKVDVSTSFDLWRRISDELKERGLAESDGFPKVITND